jgi:hypothetical protein
MSRLEWTRTIEDGCRIYRSGLYEIREMYEETPDAKFDLCYQGRHLSDHKHIRYLKEYAEWHWMHT